MKPWSEVEASPEFQALPDTDKSRAQSEYFDDVVSPQLEPQDVEAARTEFFSQFQRSYLPKDSGQSQGSSALGQAAQSLAKVGTGTAEGVGKFAQSYVRNLNPVGLAARAGVPGAQTLVDAYAAVPEALASGAEATQQAVEEAAPVNPLYADTMPVKAAGVAGQVAGQLGTVLTGAAFTKAPKILQLLGLGQAATMGIDSGYDEADRLGVTNPWERDALALSYAAAEAGVEGMGGFGSPSFTKALTGQIRETLAPSIVRGGRTALTEGVEEPITGTLQAGASNVFAEEDPNRPGYAVNGQPLPTMDITNPEFWKNRGEEFLLGTMGGVLFAGAQFAGSRPRVDEAKKLLQKADLTLAVMQNKPDLTEEEAQDLSELQETRTNLSTFISTEEAPPADFGTEATRAAAQSAAAADLPEAAKVMEELASLTSAQGLPSFESTELEGQPIEENATNEVLTPDAAPTDETPPIVAWEDSPEFTQAEELAASGDIEAAEALEAAFRERQVQTPVQPESAPQATERPNTAPVSEARVTPLIQPAPEGLDPYWVQQGRSQTTSEREVTTELREYTDPERTELQGILGTADNKPQTLAKAIKALQPQTGSRGPSSFQTERGRGARRDAIDDVRESEEGSARSRLRSPERSLPIRVSLEDAQQAVQGLAGVLPNVQNARLIEDRSQVLEDDEVRRQFVAAERAYDPTLTEEEASDIFDRMVTNPRAEGFTLGGQTYVFLDGVGVRASDKSASGAVRRVLVHEDAHESIEAAVEADPELAAEWESLKAQIPQEDLNTLSRTYSRGPGRTDAQYQNDLAHEYFARQMEALERGDIEPDGLLEQFLQWIRKVLSRISGSPEQDITQQQIVEFVRAGRQARIRGLRQSGQIMARPSLQDPTLQPMTDSLVPELPEGSAERITYEAPYPGFTKENLAAYAWPGFYSAWTANNGVDEPLTPKQQAQLQSDWQAELADENAMEIAAQNLFMEERTRRQNMDVYNPSPLATPPEVDGGARFSLRPPEDYSPSATREAEYKAILDNPTIPEAMKDYTQFLGSPLKSKRVKQAIAPMVDFARSKMGAFLGDPLEVTAANTERIKELANQAFTLDPRASRDFADQISEEFRASGFARVDGQALHQGSVMAGVLQQEILDYAVRLAAEGDPSLALQLLPFANDVVAQDHATVSNAGRALQLRSMASRQPGLWTALKGLASGQAEMAQMDPELFQTLRDALFAPQVASETLSGLEQDIATPEGQKALEGAPESEQDLLDRYTGRAMAIMDEDYRATANAWWNTMIELEELLALQQAQQAAPASAAKQSISANEAEAYRNDPVALQQRIDTLRKQAEKYLKKLAAPKDSPLSQEDRKKLTSSNKIRRAKKAVSADAQAKKMLEALENKPTRQKAAKPSWRKTYEEQIRQPRDKTEFLSDLTKQGIEAETAERLYNEAKKVTRERQDRADARQATAEAVSEARERVREQKQEMGRPARIADQKAFLNDLVRQIFAAPIEVQSNPEWRRSIMVEAFKREGFSQGSSENATDYLGPKLDQRLAEAQVKAAQQAAKGLDMKKPTLEKLIKAIRSKAVDPLNADPVTKALAAEAGFAGLSPEDFQKLAKLDVQMQGPHQTLRAKAARDMMEITLAAKPPKKWADILTQSWINSALSSVSTLSLSGIHAGFIPTRRVMFDMAALAGDVLTGKTKPADAAQIAANIMGNLVHAASYMPAVARYAGMSDSYTQRQLDFISSMHSMQAELQNSAKVMKDPNASAADKGKAALKMVFGSTDMVRRLLSTADEVWGSMLQDFILRNEAMRQLVQKAGLSPEEVGIIFQSAANEGRAAGNAHRANGGDNMEATLVERDATQQAILDAVRSASGQDVAEDVAQTSALEAPMELGNRGAEQGAWFDVANHAMEWVKQLAIASRQKNELFGRAVTGFVTVPANVLSRSAYFTPLGIGRALYKMGKLGGSKEKILKAYEETMRTEGQQRMRLIEGITGTMMMILLASLIGGDDEEGLQVTGSGPEDKGLKEAWLKKGHGPNRIEWVNANGDVLYSIPYARGGFDHLNLPLTMVGSMDDMRLKGIKPQPANAEWGVMYGKTILHGLFDQAKFFGLKNVAAMPTQMTERSLASQAAYLAAPIIPWSGFTKSIGRAWTGQTDQSSVRSAVLAQLPFTNFYAQPALNALGDQRGAGPNDAAMDRALMTGFPGFIGDSDKGPDKDIYDLYIRRGVAPNAPYRANIERTQGFITDQQWEDYLKARGKFIKDQSRKNLRRMNLMKQRDLQLFMERISAEGTRFAKEKMGWE